MEAILHGCYGHCERGKMMLGAARRVRKLFRKLKLLKCRRILPALVGMRESKNYSTRDSHVVTHHSTNLAIQCLTRAERTGSRVFIVL
jgi:hypothetical protein